MHIAVVGTGYVGLVVGAGFAESGNDVICVDIDTEKIGKLKQGIIPIYEPGLEELVKWNMREGRLAFTTNLRDGVERSEVIFLALPTPSMNDGSADLQYVLGVAKQVGQYMNGYRVIVDKSTVPVGTVHKVREVIQKETAFEFDVVSNPEFLKEGAAVQDFLKPDRIVIGSSSKRAIDIMQELNAPFVRTGNPIIIMGERSAELVKYAANAFLATKISFMNDIANLCERVGADVDDVRIGVGTDYRIGSQFLFPGTGWGGSCLPKDVKALIKTAEDHGYSLDIVKATELVNERQKRILVDRICEHYSHDLKDEVFAIWGLSFKPRTDDIRDAPSIVIIRSLLDKGARVKAHDPIANEVMRKLLGNAIEYCDISYDAVKGADGLVVVTEWSEFRRPDFARMKELMRQPVIFDGRNIYNPQKMRERGFVYYGVGRK